jgi:hypothetical protein
MENKCLLFILFISLGCLSPSYSQLGDISNATIFVVYGDSRSNPEVHRQVVEEISSCQPEFVLHTGDFVDSGDSVAEWEEFREITQGLRIYPTVGNHDYPLENYFAIFNVSSYYSFDYNYLHIVSLNAFENVSPGSVQYRWLEDDLNSTPKWRWKVVFLHLPPYSSGEHGSDMRIRGSLVPLFERYGVAAVFSGHDHGYERSYPILKGKVHRQGVVYFVTGGGGADLYSFGAGWWTARSRSVHHFIKVEVNQTMARFTAVDVNGRIFDMYTIERPISKISVPAT